MSRAFNNNLSDFLDNGGSPLTTLTAKPKKLFRHLAEIVQFISVDPINRRNEKLVCWNAPQRKCCKGHIDVSFEVPSLNIFWHCVLCGTHGRIRNWQGSYLDAGFRG